jgi:hypothetical protein
LVLVPIKDQKTNVFLVIVKKSRGPRMHDGKKHQLEFRQFSPLSYKKLRFNDKIGIKCGLLDFGPR